LTNQRAVKDIDEALPNRPLDLAKAKGGKGHTRKGYGDGHAATTTQRPFQFRTKAAAMA